MSRVTAGRSSIKVSAVCLCLSPVCTVIMADSTTGYGVINREPPVIVCCVFSPNSSPNPSLLLAFNLLQPSGQRHKLTHSAPYSRMLQALV